MLLLILLCALGAVAEIYTIRAQDNATNFALRHGLQYLKTVAGYNVYRGSLNKRNPPPVGLTLDRKRRHFKRYYRSGVTDPLYPSQWHLHGSSKASIDALEEGGPTGKGITVAIVDDGIQFRHPDLAGNYKSELSHNFNSGPASDPTPSRDDGHGTSAAGTCCAARNTVCGRGIAYQASLAGIRLIAEGTYDYEEAQGLSYMWDKIRIYSNSWGPEDSGRDMVAPGQVTKEALRRGFEERGTIYIWAGGNGRTNGDSSNYDAYANSAYTLAIGALDYNGNVAYYSEGGANLLAVAPSSGVSGRGIVTTDLMGSYGYSAGECTFSFGGTSAAAPLAAGIAAILLEVNPSFKARDIMHIIAKGATKIGRSYEYSTVNGRGYSHSNDYGFGLLKVPALLAIARNFTSVPTMKRIVVGNGGDSLSFVERALVTVTILGLRGSTTIKLISPQTVSVLAVPHNDVHSGPFTWTFSSLRHFGEEFRKGDVWTVSEDPRGSVRDVKIELLGY